MILKNLSNTSREEMVQYALEAFEANERLVFHVNRARSKVEIAPQVGKHLVIDSDLHRRCLSSVENKIDETAHYYFTNVNQFTCCIDQKVIEHFELEARKGHPEFTFVELTALVDVNCDIELIPSERADSFGEGDENMSLGTKVRALIAMKRAQSDSNPNINGT